MGMNVGSFRIHATKRPYMQQKHPSWTRSNTKHISKSRAKDNANFTDCKETGRQESLSYVVCQPDVQSQSSGTSETVGSSWGQNSSPISGSSTRSFRSKKSRVVLEHPAHSTVLRLRYHEESPQGIKFGNRGRASEGIDDRPEQLAWERVLMGTTLKFLYSCRMELLWRRPMQFRIQHSAACKYNLNCQASYVVR